MYELAIDNLLVGQFPGLAEAKGEAARLAGVPLLFTFLLGAERGGNGAPSLMGAAIGLPSHRGS
jgi:hypothetical protein